MEAGIDALTRALASARAERDAAREELEGLRRSAREEVLHLRRQLEARDREIEALQRRAAALGDGLRRMRERLDAALAAEPQATPQPQTPSPQPAPPAAQEPGELTLL
ncbi:MAG: hypothetical protein D6739_07480 [Nitrospirae bacterium]|nr:MAG: hypothetical protein D6739_07480 [Nitrospirota bacterium]